MPYCYYKLVTNVIRAVKIHFVIPVVCRLIYHGFQPISIQGSNHPDIITYTTPLMLHCLVLGANLTYPIEGFSHSQLQQTPAAVNCGKQSKHAKLGLTHWCEWLTTTAQWQHRLIDTMLFFHLCTNPLSQIIQQSPCTQVLHNFHFFIVTRFKWLFGMSILMCVEKHCLVYTIESIGCSNSVFAAHPFIRYDVYLTTNNLLLSWRKCSEQRF